jgi:hypothetical protein
MPQDWSEAKRDQKDVDARRTKKHGKSYFGSKNHIGVDAAHKLIRTLEVTPANVHDSRVHDDLIDPTTRIPACRPVVPTVARRPRRCSPRPATRVTSARRAKPGSRSAPSWRRATASAPGSAKKIAGHCVPVRPNRTFLVNALAAANASCEKRNF